MTAPRRCLIPQGVGSAHGAVQAGEYQRKIKSRIIWAQLVLIFSNLNGMYLVITSWFLFRTHFQTAATYRVDFPRGVPTRHRNPSVVIAHLLRDVVFKSCLRPRHHRTGMVTPPAVVPRMIQLRPFERRWWQALNIPAI